MQCLVSNTILILNYFLDVEFDLNNNKNNALCTSGAPGQTVDATTPNTSRSRGKTTISSPN